MTRITIEVNEGGAVSTGTDPAGSAAAPQSALGASAPAADPFAGAINAGGAPEVGADNAPHLFIGSSTPPAGVAAHDAMSAGAAPAHVFGTSGGGVA